MNLNIKIVLFCTILAFPVQAQFVHFWTPTSSTFFNNRNYSNRYTMPIKPGMAASDRALVFKMPYDTLLSSSDPLYKIQQARRSGEYAACIASVDSLLTMSPDNPGYIKEKIYAELRRDMSSGKKADSLYQGIKSRCAPLDTAILFTTISFYKSSDSKTLIKMYSRALVSYPAVPLFYYNRAILYIRDGRFDLASGDLIKVNQFLPEDVQVLYALGYCYKWLSKAKKGIEVLNKAESLLNDQENQLLENAIDRNGFYSLRSSLYNNVGNRELYIKDLEKASEFKAWEGCNANPQQ